MPSPSTPSPLAPAATFRPRAVVVDTARLRAAVLLAAAAWTSGAHADVCRVTDLGSPLGDGSDWGAQALTLPAALAMPACTEVWVRAGVYVPTTDADPTISFDIRPGVAVYGGFNGTEVTRDARDPAAYVTILSGDIDANDIDVDDNHIAESVADIQGTNSRRLVLMDRHHGGGADHREHRTRRLCPHGRRLRGRAAGARRRPVLQRLRQRPRAATPINCSARSPTTRRDADDAARPQGPQCDIGAVEVAVDVIFAEGFEQGD